MHLKLFPAMLAVAERLDAAFQSHFNCVYSSNISNWPPIRITALSQISCFINYLTILLSPRFYRMRMPVSNDLSIWVSLWRTSPAVVAVAANAMMPQTATTSPSVWRICLNILSATFCTNHRRWVLPWSRQLHWYSDGWPYSKDVQTLRGYIWRHPRINTGMKSTAFTTDAVIIRVPLYRFIQYQIR